MERALELTLGAKVLDLGCALGYHSIELGRVDELFVAPIVAQDSILVWWSYGQVRNLGYKRISPNSSTEPS
jgi:protein-L-isoaspartate O-methyltransferase